MEVGDVIIQVRFDPLQALYFIKDEFKLTVIGSDTFLRFSLCLASTFPCSARLKSVDSCIFCLIYIFFIFYFASSSRRVFFWSVL